MHIKRYNIETERVNTHLGLLTLQKNQDPVIIAIDQSSTCTGVIIGSFTKEAVYERIAIIRQASKETADAYAIYLEEVLTELVKNLNVKVFSHEDVISKSFHKSDTAVKKIVGVIARVYLKAKCLDDNGNEIQMSKNAVIEKVNNNSWKASTLPPEIISIKDNATRKYRTQMYFSRVLDLVELPEDVSDAFGIYLHLMKTKYGSGLLYPSKANIDYKHNLVVEGFAFRDLTINDVAIRKLATSSSDYAWNDKQKEFVKKYRESYVRRLISIFNATVYEDEYLTDSLYLFNGAIKNMLNVKDKTEIVEISKNYAYIKNKMDDGARLREFAYNYSLSAEDNFRALTVDNSTIYYTVVERSSDFCYLIPMFKVNLAFNDNMILVGTRI